MQRLLLCAALVTASASAVAADVALSIAIGQPGFYGQIDIGDYPPPPVVYRRPIVVERVERVEFERAPVYLRVPPAHARNWKRYCRDYGACAERVYFVQNTWYQREYVPRYQHHREQGREMNWNTAPDQDRRNESDERRSQGRGQGHGHYR